MTIGSRAILRKALSGGCLAAILSSCASVPDWPPVDALAQLPFSNRCAAMAALVSGNTPVDGLVITASTWVAEATPVQTREPASRSIF